MKRLWAFSQNSMRSHATATFSDPARRDVSANTRQRLPGPASPHFGVTTTGTHYRDPALLPVRDGLSRTSFREQASPSTPAGALIYSRRDATSPLHTDRRRWSTDSLLYGSPAGEAASLRAPTPRSRWDSRQEYSPRGPPSSGQTVRTAKLRAASEGTMLHAQSRAGRAQHDFCGQLSRSSLGELASPEPNSPLRRKVPAARSEQGSFERGSTTICSTAQESFGFENGYGAHARRDAEGHFDQGTMSISSNAAE
jgi:hypothetical protein